MLDRIEGWFLSILMRRDRLAMRCRPALITALIRALAACGRLEATTGPGASSEVPPWLEGASSDAPALVPWDGGPPVWNISFDLTQDVILEAKLGTSTEARAALGMPDECLEYENGEGPIFTAPWKTCALPALAKLGAEEAALRFLDATGAMVYAVEGTGDVKVAWALNWETWGMQDDQTFTYVFTPQGFYLEPFTRDEAWAPYAEALWAAYSDDVYGDLRALFPSRDTSEPYATWPLSFGSEYGDPYGVPQPYGGGWAIAVTKVVDQPTECHGCQTEFGVLISLDFSSTGAPVSARYLGYCWFPERHSWLNDVEGVRTAELITGTDSLAERLPTCPEPFAPEPPVLTQ